MNILFLHGWQSTPGGRKPTYLKDHGHSVLNPVLPDDDFDAAVRIAQAEFDQHQPDVIVGSSRGGAVAMNIEGGDTPLVLLCPAWKRWGTASTVKPGTVILHSRADDVILIADSEELLRNSGLPDSALIVVGTEHRLADPESLAAMLEAVERFGETARVLANPVSHEAGVPNRFGVGTLLVISTMYAVLFAVWRFMKWPPIVLVWVALFFFAIGLGQMLLFSGQRPRRASVIVGACVYPFMLLAYVAYEEHAIPADTVPGLLICIPVGMFLGYLAGSLIAAHFLLIDKLKSLRVRTKDIDPADGAGT
jgi:hypothetical protein